MKKTLSIIIVLCVLLFIAACKTELPDPVSEVGTFYEETIKNIESDLAKKMVKESAFHDLVKGIPELEEPLKEFISVYLDDIEYRIVEDETDIDSKAQTARVVVAVSCVDMKKLNERMATLVIEKSNEIMATGRNATEEELNEYYLATAMQLITDGEAERISGYQEVELSYNEASAKWEVTNGDALISELAV